MNHVLGYLRPYKLRLLGASLALLFTAGATLSLGLGVQVLIDRGFGGGTSADLNAAIALLVAIAAAIALGTFVRFYLVSILFIIFDLEIAFLFPWAVAFGVLSDVAFWSMMVFLAVLTIGFAYEWKKGALEWE